MTKSGSTLKAARILGLCLGLGLAATATSGCSSIGSALGLEKTAPDEFAVVTKAPLVIPPDFSLRPPQPGAARPNEQSPSSAASTAVFQTAGNEVAPATQTEGEKELIALAGADDTDGSIRQIVEEDYAVSTAPRKTMLGRLAFWRKNETEAAPPEVAGSADKAAQEAKERYVEREKRKTFSERIFFWRKSDKDEDSKDAEETSDEETTDEGTQSSTNDEFLTPEIVEDNNQD
ncbi:MAG: DUF3035 domain-containing protein [Alphaproteobacteria bacterium]|nr:MAG: DUF3035 domain-containing protein [Alphaproteobacteria bacterium]